MEYTIAGGKTVACLQRVQAVVALFAIVFVVMLIMYKRRVSQLTEQHGGTRGANATANAMKVQTSFDTPM